MSQSYGGVTFPAVSSLSNRILSDTTWLSSSNWALQKTFDAVEARVTAVTASMSTYSNMFTTSLSPWLLNAEATYNSNAYFAVSSQISSLGSRVNAADTMTTLVDTTNTSANLPNLYDTTTAVSSALYAQTVYFNSISNSFDSRTKQLEKAFSIPRMVVANVSTQTIWTYGASNTVAYGNTGIFVTSSFNNAIIFSSGASAVTLFAKVPPPPLNYVIAEGDTVTVVNYSTTSSIAIVNTWEFGNLATSTSQNPPILMDIADTKKTLVKTVTFAPSEKIRFVFMGTYWMFLRNQ